MENRYERASTRIAESIRPRYAGPVSRLQIDPRFRSLPVDIVLEKDVAVTLRGGAVPGVAFYTPQSKGQRVIHTGGSPMSYLQLRVKAVENSEQESPT